MTSLLRTWSSIAIALATLALAACHTVEGAGRDVSATGRAVSNSAERAMPR